MMTNSTTPTLGADPDKMPGEPAKAGDTGPVLDHAKHAAEQLIGQTKEQLGNRLSAGKDVVTDRAHDVASAIREAGDKLGDKESALPKYATQAADQVERLSRYVKSHNLGELVGDVETFARKEPVIFLGGAFAVGLVAARFIKSSAHHEATEKAQTGGPNKLMMGRPTTTQPMAPRPAASASSSQERAGTPAHAGNTLPGSGGTPGGRQP